MPTALASIRPVQWVASPGGGPSARSTTRCMVATGSGRFPGLRVLSRVSPAIPSAMNRACQRHTTSLDLPRTAHDLGGAAVVSRGEDDFGAPDVLLRRSYL